MDTVRERQILHDVSWAEFERLLAAKNDKRVPLFAYLDGTLELVSPSTDHDWITRQIEHLLMVYAVEHGIMMSCLGSSTLKSKLKAAGIEPDNCYYFGAQWRGRRRPDLAVEVAWSRGGVKKLEIYRRFHVPEVWIWKKDAITIYRLGREGYRPVECSLFVPDLDIEQLLSFVGDEPTTTATIAYRDALRSSVPVHAPARRAADRRRAPRR